MIFKLHDGNEFGKRCGNTVEPSFTVEYTTKSETGNFDNLLLKVEGETFTDATFFIPHVGETILSEGVEYEVNDIIRVYNTNEYVCVVTILLTKRETNKYVADIQGSTKEI